MLANYFVTALRTFLRHPVYSFINISGLVLGLTCSIFIFLWVANEFGYDRYHPENDRVFKVMENDVNADGEVETSQWTQAELVERLQQEIPEVDKACRLNWTDHKLVTYQNVTSYEYGLKTDPSAAEVFNLTLLEGSYDKVLPDSRSVAICKKMALKYFKGEPALGKTLRFDNAEDYTVTAVFEDLPENISWWFNFMTLFDIRQTDEGWQVTFAKLKDPGMERRVNDKLKGIAKALNPEGNRSYFLFPMMDWHLYNQFENGVQKGGLISYVVSFSLVAIFILVIACINFMNLSTARAANRCREVGIRKVAGATRVVLIRQFMIESITLSFLSMGIALLFVHMLLTPFNVFVHKHLTVDYGNPVITLSLLCIALLTGILAGSYPAFFLSSFRPASALKGNLQSVFSGASLRKALVIFQFGLSVVIIICAMVVNDQILFMRNLNLGFDKENVILVNANEQLADRYDGLRNELLASPAIVSTSISSANPMEINGIEYYDWDGRIGDQDVPFNEAYCDYDYVKTLNFTLIEGRSFSRYFPADSNNFIVNESVVRHIGYEHPVGRRLRLGERSGEIIGVIKDFNNLGVYELHRPAVLMLGRTMKDFGDWASMFVRYEPGQYNRAMEDLQKVYKKYVPDYPMEYEFLDQSFEEQVRHEAMAAQLSNVFTFLAVAISGLGLFGLALFNTERRVKEIGVRKVLGANVSGLVILLCRDFVKLVLWAVVIGSPIAYFLMDSFLQKYPYHTELRWTLFALPALLIMMFSLSIISWQSFKAAMNNPVEALRNQ